MAYVVVSANLDATFSCFSTREGPPFADIVLALLPAEANAARSSSRGTFTLLISAYRCSFGLLLSALLEPH
jgi:hypothetical protein